MVIAYLFLLGLPIALFARQPLRAKVSLLFYSFFLLGIALIALYHPSSAMVHGALFALHPLRAWFLLLLAIVAVAVSWYRFGYQDHDNTATAFWLPLFLMSMTGVLMANTVWLFITFWEFMSIASFFLVIVHHDREHVLPSGYVYLVMSQISAMAIIGGLFLLVSQVHSADLSVIAIKAHSMDPGMKNWVYALLFLGFSMKSGVIPFHIWLPRAHPIAPTPVSSLMSGVMIKLGVFGILQFLFLDVGVPQVFWAVLFLLVGAVTALLGVLYALMEKDLKRLLAFSSIENIGILFLGLGLMAVGLVLHRPTLEVTGMIATLFHAFNHALFKSQLFMIAGAVQQHTGTLDAERLGGLLRTMPGMGIAFIGGSMAISGLPPFNGFLSEWLTFHGLLSLMEHFGAFWMIVSFAVILMLAMTGALACLCFVNATGALFLGVPRASRSEHPIGMAMTMPVIGLLFVCLAIGIDPNWLLSPLFAVFPQKPTLAVSSFFPSSLMVMSIVLLLLLTFFLWLSRFWTMKKVPNWQCGRVVHEQRQMSFTAFTKSVRTSLAIIYRPHRHLERTGMQAAYFPEQLIYRGGVRSIWEKYLYRPTYRLVWRLSGLTSILQAGSIQLYLIYMLGTIGLFLLFVH